MAEGVQLEEFGGDIPAVHVSGLTGEGLSDLIETLSAVAEYRDLRAEADGIAVGHIIESNMHKGLGYVSYFAFQQNFLAYVGVEGPLQLFWSAEAALRLGTMSLAASHKPKCAA